jgi:cadmium resistance protein CadD (predicted permease)
VKNTNSGVNMISHISIAFITFVITNIDDLVILSVYFASNKYRTINIVAGQYIGILILIAIGLSGLIFGKFLEEHWTSLLGIFPLAIGVKDLIQVISTPSSDQVTMDASEGKCQVLAVALVTIANGGDNIGVYTPLFANIGGWVVSIYVVVFLVLTGAWCFLANRLVNQPKIRTVLSRYGRIILPVFLILLGLFIMKVFALWLLNQ